MRIRSRCTAVVGLLVVSNVFGFAPSLRHSSLPNAQSSSSNEGYSLLNKFSFQSHPHHQHHCSSSSSALPMLRVAYQGEPGAYSEKSTRELLGDHVTAIGRPDFESCFRAVVARECDYACLPVENSLGGSIHENYDLLLRYSDLTICAEHEFRVQHCVLAKDGVSLDDKKNPVKYAISHPQALAQCDNYLRGLGITPIPTYDTAGSAKMIRDDELPDQCTSENTIAIASDLAGTTYGLTCLAKGVEDDDSNFTRFLLLGRKGVVDFLNDAIPSKTSVVFTLPDTAGALYKALACFSLREIDMSKIESRPTSASLLNYLKFKNIQSQQKKNGNKKGKKDDSKEEQPELLPRFRYCFYLDFLSGQTDANAENALAHLREQADYVRILGSYPAKSKLVGPVLEAVEALKSQGATATAGSTSSTSLPSDANKENETPLNIGIVGFGSFGRFLASRMTLDHHVSCMDLVDKSAKAKEMGVDFYDQYDTNFFSGLDVVIVSVPMVAFEETIQLLPKDQLRGKLVVDVCPVNDHPKNAMITAFANYPDIDILCTNPMFGPVAQNLMNGESTPIGTGNKHWNGRPLVYERVRVGDMQRCSQFLHIFEEAHCQVVEMDSKQHDSSTANAEFVAHMMGRLLLNQNLLPPTPVVSKEYAALSEVADMIGGESFDTFYGMYKFNPDAKEHIANVRESLADLDRQLAAREAYLEAQKDIQQSDRQRLLAETKLLLQEVVNSSAAAVSPPAAATSKSKSKETKET